MLELPLLLYPGLQFLYSLLPDEEGCLCVVEGVPEAGLSLLQLLYPTLQDPRGLHQLLLLELQLLMFSFIFLNLVPQVNKKN